MCNEIWAMRTFTRIGKTRLAPLSGIVLPLDYTLMVRAREPPSRMRTAHTHNRVIRLSAPRESARARFPAFLRSPRSSQFTHLRQCRSQRPTLAQWTTPTALDTRPVVPVAYAITVQTDKRSRRRDLITVTASSLYRSGRY